MNLKFVIIFLSPLVFGCSNPKSNQPIENEVVSLNGNLENLIIEEESLNFYVIGDWGRNGFFRQKDVAEAMQEAGNVIEPEFIISAGDNFYPNGVASIQDPYIFSSFENIYNGFNLFCPWYVVLGNHDYRGNSQAQIDYTQISQRWQLPDRYYHIDKILDDDRTKVRFVFIDTSPFHDEYYTEWKYRNVVSQDTVKQIKWLKRTLDASDAHWNIVIGHHPFYTSGDRKDEISYTRKHLEGIFQEYKVDAYFAGHEHDLQHQKPKDVHTHHFVSGAGSSLRPTDSLSYTRFSKSIQGFMIASILEERLTVQAVNYKGEVIYKTDILK